jgi:hypothetical protein
VCGAAWEVCGAAWEVRGTAWEVRGTAWEARDGMGSAGRHGKRARLRHAKCAPPRRPPPRRRGQGVARQSRYLDDLFAWREPVSRSRNERSRCGVLRISDTFCPTEFARSAETLESWGLNVGATLQDFEIGPPQAVAKAAKVANPRGFLSPAHPVASANGAHAAGQALPVPPVRRVMVIPGRSGRDLRGVASPMTSSEVLVHLSLRSNHQRAWAGLRPRSRKWEDTGGRY